MKIYNIVKLLRNSINKNPLATIQHFPILESEKYYLKRYVVNLMNSHSIGSELTDTDVEFIKEKLDLDLEIIGVAESIPDFQKIVMTKTMIDFIRGNFVGGLCYVAKTIRFQKVFNPVYDAWFDYVILRAKREMGVNTLTGYVWQAYDKKPRIEYLTKLINEIHPPLKIE